MRRVPIWPLLVVVACGGGGEERVATRLEPVSDEAYIHDARAPRIHLEEADRSAVRAPDFPEDARLWTAALPVGTDEAQRPSVLVATDADGKLIEDKVWVAEGGADFASGEGWSLVPYEDYDSWFKLESPGEVHYVVNGEPGAESFQMLVNVHAGGGGVRLYPANGRAGEFPGTGVRFLLYDGDRNGSYEAGDPMVIDANGDGEFDGNRNSVELYSTEDPFLVGGKAYRIGSLPWDGSFVTLAPTDEVVAVRVLLEPGAPAPDFALNDLSGKEVRFSEVRSGRPTLLAYWATW